MGLRSSIYDPHAFPGGNKSWVWMERVAKAVEIASLMEFYGTAFLGSNRELRRPRTSHITAFAP